MRTLHQTLPIDVIRLIKLPIFLDYVSKVHSSGCLLTSRYGMPVSMAFDIIFKSGCFGVDNGFILEYTGLTIFSSPFSFKVIH